MPLFLLFPIFVILAVACLIVAMMAIIFLSALSVVILLAAIALRKLGLDRRLIAYLIRSSRASASKGFKARVDDLDVPVTAVWTIEEPTPGRWDRPR